MRIVCLGDSNTWGYDSRSAFGDQYPSHIRWTGILKQHGYDVVNLGMNGMCIPVGAQLTWVKETIETEDPFDVLIIMLGSNDLLRNDAAETIGLHLQELLEKMKQIVTPERILVIAPPYLHQGTWVDTELQIQESKKLAQVYHKAAGLAGTMFLDASAWGIPVLYDGVHFTEEGHALFAEHVEAKLREFAGDRL